MFIRFCFLFGLYLVFSVNAALSHEFWISPEQYSIKSGENIVAHLRVGSNMDGAPLSYFPSGFDRFDVVFNGETLDVKSRLGDRPAMNMPIEGNGLAVVVHETSDNLLRYKSLEQFNNFLDQKDFTGVLEIHKARGLPDFGFVEQYRRFAKALIAVGNGRGFDRVQGLRTEIVALANPYTDDVSMGMPVLVLFENKPLADTQVQVFAKSDNGIVTEDILRTDAQGKLLVPVQTGVEYLVDAVVMVQLENDDAGAGPVWESLWAALTFKMP